MWLPLFFLLLVVSSLSLINAEYETTLTLSFASPHLNWLSIACSSAGDQVVAVTNGSIYRSCNYGYSWSPLSTPDESWYRISSSASGQYLYASAEDGGIYRSENYGLNWSLSSAPTSLKYSIATSASGQYVFAAAFNGNITYSNDFGVSWNTSTTILVSSSAIACSSSGQYVSITAITYIICISNNFGVVFNCSSTPQPWSVIAINSSGSFQVAASFSGNIFSSTDYGAQWTSTEAYFGDWTAICMSSSGQYVYALSDFGLSFSDDFAVSWSSGVSPVAQWNAMATSNSGQFVYAASERGLYGNYYAPSSLPSSSPSVVPSSIPSDTPSSHPTVYSEYDYTLVSVYSKIYDYYSVAMSSQGQYIYCAAQTDGLLRSSDFGNSWTLNPDVDVYIGACSSNGSYVYVVGRNVYRSSDYGVTLIETDIVAGQYFDVATTSSGQYVYLSGNQALIYSNNFGIDWYSSSVNVALLDLTVIACSLNGSFVTTVSNDGLVFISDNYGVDFVHVYTVGFASYGMSLSASGQFQVISSQANESATGFVYVSVNFGRNWSVSSAPTAFWVSTAMDASGKYMFAGQNFGYIYFSSNYGSNWNKLDCPFGEWFATAVSSNGEFLVAAAFDNGIYTNQFKIPTSVPTSNPSPVSDKPQSREPTSQPSVQPSSIPSAQPSSFPTFVPDSLVETLTLCSITSSVTTTVNNLGCGSSIFVWATILVSYLDEGSLGAISITAGSGSNTLVVADKCAPASLCGFVQCSANFNVTSVATCTGGGSVTLTATTVNVNQFTGVDTRCTFNGTSGLQFAIQYSVAAFPLPTTSPTLSPTLAGGGNVIFEASPDTPFYIIACIALLYVSLGVVLVRLRDKNETLSSLKLTSACVDLGLIGYHLSSELFYIIVVYSEDLHSLAIGIVVIRLISFGPGVYLFFRIYGHGSDFYKNLLNRPHMFSNTSVYSLLSILLMLEQTMVRYLPWNVTEYTVQSRGFPDQHMLLVCTVSKTVQLIGALSIQVAVLIKTNVRNDSDKIAKALVILYLISSIITIVMFSVTNGIRLRLGDPTRRSETARGIDDTRVSNNPLAIEMKNVCIKSETDIDDKFDERVALLAKQSAKLEVQEGLIEKDREIQQLRIEMTELKALFHAHSV